MATAVSTAAPRGSRAPSTGALGVGITTLWLSLIVLIPLSTVVWRAVEDGRWSVAFSGRALDALTLTLGASLIVTLVNAVMGTVIAWVLVRDQFPGKGIVNAIIDLPFALPTIVAGLTLIALYGQKSPIGVDLAFTRWAVLLALAFVTLPFVVRSVQPVIMELDREMEEAAASLGASNATTFRRIVLPNLFPAIVSGAALSFARAVGEFGSLVLISGNIASKTEVSSVYIFGQIESDALGAATATSVVLLGISLVVLIAIRLLERTRWAG